jgi:ribosomal protein S17E
MRLHWTNIRSHREAYFAQLGHSNILKKIKQALEITKNSENFSDYAIDNFEKNKFVIKELDKLESEHMRLIIGGIISEYQKATPNFVFYIEDVYDNLVRGNFNLSEHLGFRVLEQDIGIRDSCTFLHNIKLPFFYINLLIHNLKRFGLKYKRNYGVSSRHKFLPDSDPGCNERRRSCKNRS